MPWPMGEESDGGKPGTVAEAIVRYADNLKAEGGNVYNARMARIHLPPTILQKPVALLTGKELRHWRDSLLEGRARSSVNRIIVTLSSGLELAADLDPRITNRSAWKIGLKKLAGADVGRARNIVLPEPTVVRVVTLGYVQSHAFGLFIETKAVTGARRVQLARLTVADLQDDRPDPRLMMPSAVKGKRGKRRVDRVPVPITASLAGKLRVASAGRPPSALLLVKPDGTAWGANDPRAPFRAVAIAAGLDPNTATPYCLRHTSITRQLLAGVPVQIVSDSHDTSPLMISAHYASSITSHSDAISRRALPDFGATAPGAEVVVRQGRRA